MAHSDHYLPLYDKKGNFYAVMLSAELWNKYRHKLEPLIEGMLEEIEPVEKPEPLHEWDEFKQYWDFKYPYNARVECGNCGAQTEDWTTDPNKPFRFRGAQISGLAVFQCKPCSATVRKKHFKDHICFEYSLNACGCK
ncbi:MAG: hypothetical protein FWG59_00235 [Betaproteobacteria bacterium]|nr:hypothetical protein [Betaproteobacteria bacterium]